MKKQVFDFEEDFYEKKYGVEDLADFESEDHFHSRKRPAGEFERRFFLFKKIEHDIRAIFLMYLKEYDIDSELDKELEGIEDFRSDRARSHQHDLRVQSYQYFLGELSCVLDTCVRHFEGQDIQLLIQKVNDAILDHPFTSSDPEGALLQIERKLPITFDLYTGFIKRVSCHIDNTFIRHFIKIGAVQFDEIVSLFPVYATKQSFEALAVIFEVWLREKPFEPGTHREEIGEKAWLIIMESHAYTGTFLNPGLDRFIKRFEHELSSALPMMTKHRVTLGKLPHHHFLSALKASGYTTLAIDIGNRLRDLNHDNEAGKFKALKKVGVDISEAFIKYHLSSSRSISAWTMAMEYYLQDDDMHFDLDDLNNPGIQGKKFAYGEYLINRQTLVDLLDSHFTSSKQEEKSMALVRHYTQDNPVIIKNLLEAGLPEKYLAVESIREEKLFLDLGL